MVRSVAFHSRGTPRINAKEDEEEEEEEEEEPREEAMSPPRRRCARRWEALVAYGHRLEIVVRKQQRGGSPEVAEEALS